MTALAQAMRSAQGRLAQALPVAGWFAATTLAGIGAVALLPFLVGGMSIEGMMHQLANLATRYVAADLARRFQFDLVLLAALAIAFVLSAYFRFGALSRRFDLDQRMTR